MIFKWSEKSNICDTKNTIKIRKPDSTVLLEDFVKYFIRSLGLPQNDGQHNLLKIGSYFTNLTPESQERNENKRRM